MFDLRAKTPNQAEMSRREARKAAIELLNAGVSNEEVIERVPGMTAAIIEEIFEDGCILHRPSESDFAAKPFRCEDADLH